MFEEIRMAYQIAKKLKSVEWQVMCKPSPNGELRAHSVYNKEYGEVWIAHGYPYLALLPLGSCNNVKSPIYGLGFLSNLSKWVIWHFGGFAKISKENYVSAEKTSKVKLKEMQEKLFKRT